jgi:branched-chain amino acid transport system substrate-binding protein
MKLLALCTGALALATGLVVPAYAQEHNVSRAQVPPPRIVHPAPRDTSDIRIGLVLAGGRHAAISDDIAAGIGLALSEVQSIAGRKLVLLRDEPEGKAESRAEAFLNAGIDVLVGPATPHDIGGLRDFADARHVPLVVPVPGAAAMAVAKCSPFVLHVAPAGDQVAGPFGSWVGAQKPSKRVYLIGPEDVSARQQMSVFKRSFAAAGGEIVGEEYVAAGNPDFSPYLAKLRLVGADSIYAPFAGDAARAFARDYEASGLFRKVALFGTAAYSGIEGGPKLEGVLGGIIGAVDYVPALDTPENRRFQIDFAKRFHRSPTSYAARGYDAGHLIVEALRKSGGQTKDRDTLAKVLAEVSVTGPRGPVRAATSSERAVDRLYIVREREGEDGPRYDLIDRVPTATSASCAVSRG